MLKIENLQLRTNGNTIINDLNLHVTPGEIHGLLGENGTGKTSVAYLIMGVNNYRPTAGRITFEEQDIVSLSISQRAQRGISLAWQEPARIEGLTVRDYLKLSGKKADVTSVNKFLSMVGLEPAQYLDRDIDATLSGGERKRIEMASLLAMHPKLAIMDEPDSGIDIISLPLVLDGIVKMSKQGSSVLLITHNEKVVEIAHRVSVLCAGKIIRTGPAAETSLWFKNNCQSFLHINDPSLEI